MEEGDLSAMNAYKCDRCKCLFEPLDKNLNPTNEHVEDYKLEIRKIGRYSHLADKQFDLCPNCYEELAKFMNVQICAESEETK